MHIYYDNLSFSLMTMLFVVQPNGRKDNVPIKNNSQEVAKYIESMLKVTKETVKIFVHLRTAKYINDDFKFMLNSNDRIFIREF